MSIESVFGHDFLMVNRTLLPEVGRDGVIILSYLADLLRFDVIREYADEHSGYFFLTREKLEEEWQYSDSQQRRIIGELEKSGLVETKLIGCPPRRHIRLVEDAIDAVASRRSKPIKKLPETSKGKEEFYKDLNESIFKGFDTFKTEKSNLLPVVAAPLYVFTRLLYAKHGRKFTWDGEAYSQFKACILKYQPLDYRRLVAAVSNEKVKREDDKYLLHTFREVLKSIPSNHPSKQILDPTQLPEWGDVR